MSQRGFEPDAEFPLEFNQMKAMLLEEGGGNPYRS
jgi:hypothetical protein